ncbi:MAG: translation initiation factor IF-3 [Rhodobacteraceae bacterium]|nr:translation initiation factor IF-3 [Paracoccaceae bacterium]
MRDNRPRANERITVPEVLVIGSDGKKLGTMSPEAGSELAASEGLDLVEISPTAEPPVCKITDLGKFKYNMQKREASSRRNQKKIETKEVKFRPNTDTHDYQVKLRNVERFLENGDRVKVTMRFRGREMAHQEIGRVLLDRVADDISEIGKIETIPKLEGRQICMVIAPARK